MDLQKVAQEQQAKLEKVREERKEQIKAAAEAAPPPPPTPESPPAPAPTKPEPMAPKHPEPEPSKNADHKVDETGCWIHKQGSHIGNYWILVKANINLMIKTVFIFTWKMYLCGWLCFYLYQLQDLKRKIAPQAEMILLDFIMSIYFQKLNRWQWRIHPL